MARVIVIEGPTASGKSSVAVEVAGYFGVEVLSADSRQFYREMVIGTAAITPDEQQGVKHHFVGDRCVEEHLSAGEYETEALQVIAQLSENKDENEVAAVVVGGSGLYVRALLYGLDPLPSNSILREELNQQISEQGLSGLLDELEKLDPDYFKIVDKANPHRITRAVEVCRLTGKPYSSLRSGQKAHRKFSAHRVVIDSSREELYRRINIRVDQMIEMGLENEVRGLIPQRDLKPLKSVGYSEFFDYFDGKISHEKAVELIKQHTRNYAKRQLTWLAREPHAPRLLPSEVINYFK